VHEEHDEDEDRCPQSGADCTVQVPLASLQGSPDADQKERADGEAGPEPSSRPGRINPTIDATAIAPEAIPSRKG
jgi:hypothetical protein